MTAWKRSSASFATCSGKIPCQRQRSGAISSSRARKHGLSWVRWSMMDSWNARARMGALYYGHWL